ncbi:MAG: hypothetical protein JWM03_1643, partial [Rhodocyclales bacterium]|nr:hypothetical protein [Rhodocyclales bacterium]
MVTILKPPHRKVHDERTDIASENLPGNADLAEMESGKRRTGVELDEGDSKAGTGSAPGEG